MKSKAEEDIKKVIEDAYIKGIHTTQDENLIRGGFHKDFNMLVFQDNKIVKINIDEWLPRVEKMKADNPELWSAETTCKFQLVDAAGNSAAVKIDIFKGSLHFSTDYMLLYKFENGWKIVSKIFFVPE